MPTTKIVKWGNSFAVRIPKALAEDAQLREGEPVTVTVPTESGLVIKPSRRKYQVRQLVSRITAKNRHEETDWGKPKGKDLC